MYTILLTGTFYSARAIQDQLLKDFGSRAEFSDWFSREDEPAPKRPVILKPNPTNIQHDAKISELEAKIERYGLLLTFSGCILDGN